MSTDRALGMLLGLAVGDALGAPGEFMSAAAISQRYGQITEMIGGGWLHLAPGQTTDDTAMALCLARSVAASHSYQPDEVIERYLAWFRSSPPDVGTTTAGALGAIELGMSPEQATRRYHERMERSGGNGSLMRVAPLALMHDHEQAISAAARDSHLTHFDPLAAASCQWLVAWLYGIIRGDEQQPATTDLDIAEALAWPDEVLQAEANGQRAGYVLVTLAVATHDAVLADSFADGLISVVNRGGDADTNGAVAGAILGARFGAQAIPERWLTMISERAEVTELVMRLIAAE